MVVSGYRSLQHAAEIPLADDHRKIGITTARPLVYLVEERFIQNSACPKSWMMDIRSMMGHEQTAAVNAQQSEYRRY